MSIPGVGAVQAESRAFFVTGGTLPSSARSYVTRRADNDLLEAIVDGEFCYVLNTRQMGKSSLMTRTAAELRKQDFTVVVLDLTAVGQNLSPEQWYAGLLASFSEQVQKEDELEEYWLKSSTLGPLQRFMTAIRDVVLPRIAKGLVVFVDEIDAVRSLPFPADEFFAAIRECYNRRTRDSMYDKLTFCLLGVATPADLISDTRMSPFNIGRRIELSDFTQEEAAPLAQGIAGGLPVLQRVLYWTNGHPYMTQRLCRAVADEPGAVTGAKVDDVCERLFLTKQARDTDDNLAFVRNRLLRSDVDISALLDLYERVRSGRRVKDDETSPLVPVLRLSGVVAVHDGVLTVRNRIYDRVFDRDWISSHLPDAELRRQREAYFAGMRRTAAIAAVILAIMAILTADAMYENLKARESTQSAQSAELQASTAAQQAVQSQRVALAQKRVADMQRRRAEQQAKLARDAEMLSRQDETVAIQQTNRATAEKLAAEQASLSERDARKQASHMLRLTDLQLAGQVWDSDSGSAGQVQDLLAASRVPGSASQRFEWRYQWNLLNRSCAASVSVPDQWGVRGLAVTNGNLIAVGDPNSYVRARISDDHVEARMNLADSLPHYSWATVSDDGRYVLTADSFGRLSLRDPTSFITQRSWTTDSSDPPMFGLFGDRSDIYTASATAVDRWDMRTGVHLRHWSHSVLGQFGLCGFPYAEQFSVWATNGSFALGVNYPKPGQITVADLSRVAEPGYVAPVLSTAAGEIQSAVVSDDCSTFVAQSERGTVYVYDVASRRLRLNWNPIGSSNSSLAVSSTGVRIAVGSNDGSISVWSIGSGSPVLVDSFKGSIGSIGGLEFSPDSRWLASYDFGGVARAWNLTASVLQPVVQPSKTPVRSLSYSPDGANLAVTNMDGSISILNRDLRQAYSLPAALIEAPSVNRHELVTCVAYSSNGKYAAAAGLFEYSERSGTNTGAAGTPYVRIFLQMWSPKSGRAISEWKSPPISSSNLPGPMYGGLSDLAFSPDGKTVAGGFGPYFANSNSVLYDQVIGVWDVASGREIRVLSGMRQSVTCVAFSPDGNTLIAGCADHFVYRYDAHTWSLEGRLDCGAPVWAIAFSPDGNTLAIGGRFTGVRLCDAHDWRPYRQTLGQENTISSLAFSPDSLTLACGDFNGNVLLWDPATGRLMRSVKDPSSFVLRLAFSPDSTSLAVGDSSGGVILLRAPSQAVIDAAERSMALRRTAETALASNWETPEEDRIAENNLVRQIALQLAPGYAGSVGNYNLLLARAGTYGPRVYSDPSLGDSGVVSKIGSDREITVAVSRPASAPWSVQVYWSSLSLIAGRSYYLQFRARDTGAQSISVATQRDQSPNDQAGLSQSIELSPTWQGYRIRFTMGDLPPHHTSLVFFVGGSVDTISLADVVLVPDRLANADRLATLDSPTERN